MKTASKFAKLEAFIKSQTGTPTWAVKTTTTFPTFHGQVIEEEIVNRHGGYTTEELFKAEYFFDGYRKAGYSITKFSREKISSDEMGNIHVTLRNGPITIVAELAQYA